MSQGEENYQPTVPPATAPQPPQQPYLQPNLSPPPGYLGSGHYPDPYASPYPAPPAVHVTMYAPSAPSKSPGLAALLAFLFGPLGMLYSTVPGAFVMFGINVLLFFLGFVTIGVTWLFSFVTWIGGIVWAYMAAEAHNKQTLPPPPYYPPPTAH